MEPAAPQHTGRTAWATACGVTVAVAVYALGSWIGGVPMDIRERDGLLLLPIALLASAAALLGWRRARERWAGAHRALEQGRAEATQSARELREVAQARERAMVRERDRMRTELAREQNAARRLERLRAAERAWSDELRDAVARLHRERGGEADLPDVHATVLRVATELLGATRGLLLLRRPGDVAGHLDLAAARGFEHDPAGSAIVRRFAAGLAEGAGIVREERVAADPSDTRADAELHAIVAVPVRIRDHLHGVLVCANRRGGFGEHDDEVLRALGEAVDAKDPLLHGHAQEVARYAEAIGRRLEVEPDEQRLLSLASLLHDVGTVSISERILLKEGPLNPQEREVVELHPGIGAQVVSQVPALRPLMPAILHHHERYDGTGYPSRLAGEDIPMPARLIAVAEAFSAMTHDRPHQRGRSVPEACAILERGAGTQFDPEMVRLLVEEVRADPGLVAGARRAAEELETIPLLGTGVGVLTDHLTLLASHRAFRDAVDAAARTAAMTGVPFTVVMVRLIDLPAVNRREGYAAGDELIQAAGRALDRVAVALHGTAGRDGGGRLGLLAPRTDVRAGRQLADDLARRMGAAGRAIRTSAAVWRPGDTGASLVERALRSLDDPRSRPLAG
jgi:HD-GYP domain-containing protein (c-di-GMP phosphodiesterase class II)/GGDEF domain-containing protein